MKKMKTIREGIPAEFSDLKSLPEIYSEDDLALGRTIFEENCSKCHGPTGKGDGPLAKAMSVEPPNLVDGHHSDFYTAGEKFWIVTNGIKGAPMPSFVDKLSERERWLVIAHLIKLAESEERH